MQLAADMFAALHTSLVIGGDLGQLGKVARNFPGRQCLLFGCAGDMPVHVADGFHRIGEAGEGFASLSHLPHTFLAAALAIVDGLRRFAGTALNGLDDGIDFQGGLGW